MSWMGALIGGGLGMMFGGSIGAVIGAVVGYQVLGRGADILGTPRAGFIQERQQRVFFTAVFSMLGKLSKADGLVSPGEIKAVERIMEDRMRLNASARHMAIGAFNHAKDSGDSFEDYATRFHREFRHRPDVLMFLIELLLLVANADGAMQPVEQKMIRSAAKIFGIAFEDERAWSGTGGSSRRSSADELERSYQILGARPDEQLAAVKRKYRKLAMQHHPDRLTARGVSPEFASITEERFKEIQHAFDVVEQHLKRSQ